MKQQPNDVALLLKPVARFFQRFHLTLFIVVLVGGLAYGVVALYELINTASSTTPMATSTSVVQTTPTTADATIDQTTINQIQTMYSSSNAPGTVSLPAGRVNPFAE